MDEWIQGSWLNALYAFYTSIYSITPVLLDEIDKLWRMAPQAVVEGKVFEKKKTYNKCVYLLGTYSLVDSNSLAEFLKTTDQVYRVMYIHKEFLLKPYKYFRLCFQFTSLTTVSFTNCFDYNVCPNFLSTYSKQLVTQDGLHKIERINQFCYAMPITVLQSIIEQFVVQIDIHTNIPFKCVNVPIKIIFFIRAIRSNRDDNSGVVIVIRYTYLLSKINIHNKRQKSPC